MNRRSRGARGPTRIIALGGGKGGVGRSTLAVELGRALARHEQTVMLLDLAGADRALATLLERPLSEVTDHAMSAALKARTPSELSEAAGPPRLELLALTDVAEAMRDHDAREVWRWLRRAETDWLILDMPSGDARAWAQLFLGADLPLLVTLPEPTALCATTRFLRRCLSAALMERASASSARDAMLARMQADEGWTFRDLVGTDGSRRALLEETCARLSMGLVLNHVREANEAEQGHALTHAWSLEWGIWPELLPPIHYEDRRWFFARRNAPSLSHPRDESVAGDADGLARWMLKLDWMVWAQPRPCVASLDPEAEPRRYLALPDLDLSGNELRQLYRRLWEGYRRENGLVAHIVPSARREEAQALLEVAFKAVSRGRDGSSAGVPAVSRAAAQSAPKAPEPEPAAPQHNPGEVVRMTRLRVGLGLRELSLRTRVGVRQLEAIEAMNLDDLPDRVYLQAYLLEIARPLGLEPEALVDDYMQALNLLGETP